ncbi:MAG: peptidase S53 propeptide [Acidobacteria bacterium]|nr:MAG: peptidase S53 propeptide [Acidobacteriota bacterium]
MSERKVFEDSVTPLPAQEGLTHNGLMVNAAAPEHRDQNMTLLFSLAIPPEAQKRLEESVARGKVIPLDDLNRDYSPDAADVEKLVDWLKSEGYEIKQVSPDSTSVYARASVDKIEQSLGVNMVRVTKDGLTYTAAQNAPSLPAEVGQGVHAIIGLQPFRQAHKHSRKCVPRDGNRVSLAAGAVETPSPSPNIQNEPPYLVNEVRKAYGADGLPVTGKGQTIAILIDNFPADADLKAFWQRNNLPTDTSRIERVNVKGGPLAPPEGEETLDVQWSSGIAPDAKVRVYASGSLRFVDLDLALDRIIADLPGRPGMRQLSISLGLGETFMGGPQGEVAVQHQKFLRLAAAGVNVFVSSGDAGSNPDVTGHGTGSVSQAEYESSDPTVIGVGGTTLTLTSGGDIASETGWTGSGGGTSIFFSRPSWQTGQGVPPGGMRLVPDVSLAADPDKGAFIVLNGNVMQIGGTSWSAPVWAGFCALINEARAKANKPPLPFLNPLLYPLMGTSCFRDIKAGNNGAFDAGPGYDMITGIGVPNVKELIQALT